MGAKPGDLRRGSKSVAVSPAVGALRRALDLLVSAQSTQAQQAQQAEPADFVPDRILPRSEILE